jgi:hypothetical protein
MRPRKLSPIDREQRVPHRTWLLSVATFALTGTLALSVAAPASAATAERRGCGWNPGTSTDHAFYEHCATNTNVWIQVTRWLRGDYHRCVGPGRTVLDSDATGAWYDSGYRGGLCDHPGDTGP